MPAVDVAVQSPGLVGGGAEGGGRRPHLPRRRLDGRRGRGQQPGRGVDYCWVVCWSVIVYIIVGWSDGLVV